MTDEPQTLKERIEADDNPDATYYVPPNSGIKSIPNYRVEDEDDD